jgi:hypothetical protein
MLRISGFRCQLSKHVIIKPRTAMWNTAWGIPLLVQGKPRTAMWNTTWGIPLWVQGKPRTAMVQGKHNASKNVPVPLIPSHAIISAN